MPSHATQPAPSESLPDVFGGIQPDPNFSHQLSDVNPDEADYDINLALTEWGNGKLPSSLESSQPASIPSLDMSSMSPEALYVAPEVDPSITTSLTLTKDQKTVCYGMVSIYRNLLPKPF